MEPMSRKYVRDRMTEKTCVAHASPIGDGLKVVKKGTETEINTFTAFLEDTRWYVASFHCPEGQSTEITLMPIPQE